MRAVDFDKLLLSIAASWTYERFLTHLLDDKHLNPAQSCCFEKKNFDNANPECVILKLILKVYNLKYKH